MERREQIRYGVRALVDFEWKDEETLRRGQGVTRDISTKGMFIYAEITPPVKADLRVNVSFRNIGSVPTKLWMRAKGLVIRVEPAAGPDANEGFAILNRSYELHDGVNPVRD
ncbi:MAG: PilZ domain-containing protein [Candidatus Acidiferrales bacterium]